MSFKQHRAKPPAKGPTSVFAPEWRKNVDEKILSRVRENVFAPRGAQKHYRALPARLFLNERIKL